MKRALLLAALCMSLPIAPTVYAGLGGDSANVQADADALHGVVKWKSGTLYDVGEFSTDTGIRVREYLSRTGMVFAIAWDGPVLPDLQQLLGSYFVPYTTALVAQDHLGLRRSLRLASSDLVVESGGHLRAYVGRAYLPLRLPADVALTELR
jgi:hypothetical protein